MHKPHFFCEIVRSCFALETHVGGRVATRVWPVFVRLRPVLNYRQQGKAKEQVYCAPGTHKVVRICLRKAKRFTAEA
jgi:hypothetical protein